MIKKFFLATLVAFAFVHANAAPVKGKRVSQRSNIEHETTRSHASYGSSSLGGNALQAHLGFGQSAINFGAEFLLPAAGNAEWGPYFMFLSEKEDAGRPKVLTLGGSVKVHYVTNPWDLYIAPGFGFMSVDAGDEDESTLGPSFRVGALYSMTDAVSIGMEQVTLYNWFSDELGGDITVTNATLRFAF